MGQPSQYTQYSQPRPSPVIIQAEPHKSGVAPILAEKSEPYRKSPRKYQKSPINQTVQEIILGESPYPNRNSPKITKKRPKRHTDILWNLHTGKQFKVTYHQLDTARSKVEWKQIWRETSISHVCILSLLLYFDMAQSVPHGFMHAIYINLFKGLIRLWCGKYKGLDSGSRTYVIMGAIWKNIGIETSCTVKTIPAMFVQSMPNINTDFNSYTAKDNAFWLTWLAPYLLANWL
jgi:hypothetical protein